MMAEAQGLEDHVQDISTDHERLIIHAEFPSVPPEDLFTAWTVPAQLTRWWPRQAEIEPGVGGAYHLSWPGTEWHLRGTYTAWDPGSRLAFTWCWDHDPSEVTPKHVDVRFIAAPGGSRLLLTHGMYPDTSEASEERQGHLVGWQTFLSKLQALYGTNASRKQAVAGDDQTGRNDRC